MGSLLLLAGCIDFYAGIPCTAADECPDGYTCASAGVCASIAAPPSVDEPGEDSGPHDTGATAARCPDDVIADLGFVVMDAYEASRPDATAENPGAVQSIACSVPGVLPWAVLPDSSSGLRDTVLGACEAAGKRICTAEELERACVGESAGNWPYPYGDEYVSGRCNDAEAGVGAAAPTGSFPECVDGTGTVHDLVGNVKDGSGDSDGIGQQRGGNWEDGGAYEASCHGTSSATWVADGIGFRCCK